MIATGDPASHEEAWLALPWLANGRLSQAERDRIEAHVRGCAPCREELAFQRLLCNALTEPDRVTYAPGPSFRKLMDRIDGTAPHTRPTRERGRAPATLAARVRNNSRVSLWRPPGLAWAASFVLAVGLAGVATTMYRSSQAVYTTHTEAAHVPANVLHISFDRSVTIGEAEAVLRSAGARVVEGPDSTGILGITPNAGAAGKAAPERTSREMRVLSARLRADPRVRWVEPVPGDDSPGGAQVSTFRGP
jgi:Putative zinc-finger